MEESNHVTNENRSGWTLDGGATSHYCTDIEKFVTLNKDVHKIVTVADGYEYKVSGMGDIKLRMNLKTSSEELKEAMMTMKDVLYVPELGKNLMFVKKLMAQGHSLYQQGDYGKIFLKNNQDLWISFKDKRLYTVGVLGEKSTQVGTEAKTTSKNVREMNSDKRNDNKLALVHARMGHCGI
jgi:hypothetical protein